MSYEISRLGHQGDGIAPGPLYAPRTLPGEVITATPQGDQLTDIRITTPSSDRIKPSCAVYNTCGGCALQHASLAFVANWKVGVVRQALAAQGIEARIDGPETSAPQSRRRAKLTGKRTKKGAIVGFHGRASHSVASALGCQVITPGIAGLVPALEKLTLRFGSRKGSLGMSVLETARGFDLALNGGRDAGPEDLAALSAWCRTHGVLRLVINDQVALQEAAPMVSLGSAMVSPPPGAFLQATEHGQEALTLAVSRALNDAKNCLDLFSGAGTFALALAATRPVHAVEGEADLTEALAQGWRMAKGLRPVTTEVRDLFKRPLDADDLRKFDGVVIDPPRAGAEHQMGYLAASDIPYIASVSCNPVTFARDAAILLTGGYSLNWVQVVDQFRWSPHVEIAAGFTKDS